MELVEFNEDLVFKSLPMPILSHGEKEDSDEFITEDKVEITSNDDIVTKLYQYELFSNFDMNIKKNFCNILILIIITLCFWSILCFNY